MVARTDLEPVIEIISRYLARVEKEYPVQAAYLFGSYAQGSATKDSDIDLAIISSALQGNRFHDNSKLGVLTWGVDTRIEPWGFRPEDFSEDHLLPAEIMRTGIKVYPQEN